MITKFLKTSVVLGLCATSMFAQPKVEKATDNLGDFLIAPLYIAQSDICSEIRVMNTNEYSSILAKVAIREQIASHEVDLPIFLSPGDVWSGTVCERNGKIILTSTDDSNHPAAKDMLRRGIDLNAHSKVSSYRENDLRKGYVEINGKAFKLEEVQKDNIDFSKGYVEIYPVAQFDEGNKNKVDKKLLVYRWNRLIEGDMSNAKLRRYGVDNYSLSGSIVFKTSKQETSSIPMTAFKNVHSKTVTGEAINFSSDSVPDILIGKANKEAILKLLKKKTFAFTYDNAGKSQYVYIAFPFGYKEKQSRRYKLIIRDMHENKYTMVFSPKFLLHNELACLSVEELIAITNNPKKFHKGIIHIKDITNNDEVQLGKNKVASSIPTLSKVSDIGNKKLVINSKYLPAKN
jgi:hypothetical protein